MELLITISCMYTIVVAKDAGFAQEALAGLASKENFSKVSLRKTADQPSTSTTRLEPYKDLMLIHIKGMSSCG